MAAVGPLATQLAAAIGVFTGFVVLQVVTVMPLVPALHATPVELVTVAAGQLIVVQEFEEVAVWATQAVAIAVATALGAEQVVVTHWLPDARLELVQAAARPLVTGVVVVQLVLV